MLPKRRRIDSQVQNNIPDFTLGHPDNLADCPRRQLEVQAAHNSEGRRTPEDFANCESGAGGSFDIGTEDFGEDTSVIEEKGRKHPKATGNRGFLGPNPTGLPNAAHEATNCPMNAVIAHMLLKHPKVHRPVQPVDSRNGTEAVRGTVVPAHLPARFFANCQRAHHVRPPAMDRPWPNSPKEVV